MNRRRFIGATACMLVIAPLAARAQQAGRARRIGAGFGAHPPQTPGEISKAYPTYLRALGWIEGQNLIIERRYSGGNSELLKDLADELVGLKLDLIAAEGTIANSSGFECDPHYSHSLRKVGRPGSARGLVASLARPGGNVTGTSTISTDLYQKRLQLLRELLPEARRVGELVVPANPIELAARSDYERAYRALGMQPIFIEVSQAGELERAVDELARRGVQALHASPEPLLYTSFPKIAGAAQRHSLPIMVDEPDGLEVGALISYGPDDVELDRQLVLIIDKILRGAKPADSPCNSPESSNSASISRWRRPFGSKFRRCCCCAPTR